MDGGQSAYEKQTIYASKNHELKYRSKKQETQEEFDVNTM